MNQNEEHVVREEQEDEVCERANHKYKKALPNN